MSAARRTVRKVRTGKMPIGLRRYWDAKNKAGYRKKRARRKNPMSSYILMIKRGNSRLYFNGTKFISAGRFKHFASKDAVLRAATNLVEKYSAALRGYRFYAVK